MYDPELEEIRRKKLEEYKKRLLAQQEQQRLVAQMQIRAILRQILTKEAFERLGRVKMANPELYAKAVQMLLYLYQSGQLKGKVTDEQLKKFLERLIGKRRETKIKIL